MVSLNKVFITSITVSELLVGVNLADSESRRLKRSTFVESVINNFAILNFGVMEARIHARINADLIKQGKLIGSHDLIIASIALSYDCTVITDNIAEFSRVESLEVIDMKKLYVS